MGSKPHLMEGRTYLFCLCKGRPTAAKAFCISSSASRSLHSGPDSAGDPHQRQGRKKPLPQRGRSRPCFFQPARESLRSYPEQGRAFHPLHLPEDSNSRVKGRHAYPISVGTTRAEGEASLPRFVWKIPRSFPKALEICRTLLYYKVRE